jgi:hypothetical protein
MSEPLTESEDAWARIGLLLVLLQNAEHAINACLKWVFTHDRFGEEDEGNLLDQLSNLKEFQRKKTLGELHRALRKRVDVRQEFETYFAKFVDDRNRFVHRLFLEPEFSVNDPKDIPRIRQFVDTLTNQTMTLIALFNAYIRVWAEEHKLSDDNDYTNEPEPFKSMVQHYKRHITRKANQALQ